MNQGLTSINADAAPFSWASIDFISDLHLQASAPHTFEAFCDYLSHCTADALFILGDLFEMWVGDDILTSKQGAFDSQCVSLLKVCSSQRSTFIMRGNRDFLLGVDFFTQSGCTELSDPCTLTFEGHRFCLSHGDAYCYSDTGYMQARQTMRSAAWISAMLVKPLPERLAIGSALRAESAAYQQGLAEYADLDHAAMLKLLAEHDCHTLIHGHTHRPASEELAPNLGRIVLSDWDFDHALAARGSALTLTRGQAAI